MPAQTLITQRIQAPQVKYKNGDVGIYIFSIIVKPIKMINNTKLINTLDSDVAWIHKNDVLNKNPEESMVRMLKKTSVNFAP